MICGTNKNNIDFSDQKFHKKSVRKGTHFLNFVEPKICQFLDDHCAFESYLKSAVDR